MLIRGSSIDPTRITQAATDAVRNTLVKARKKTLIKAEKKTSLKAPVYIIYIYILYNI